MIQLTPTGKNKFHLMQPIVNAFREEAYVGLSDEQINVLDSTLNIIFNNLSKIN